MWIDRNALNTLQKELGDTNGNTMCMSFCSMLCERIIQTIAAVQNQDLQKLQILSHNIKNNAGYVGASRLGDHARQIESDCKEDNRDKVLADLDDYHACLQKTLSELHRFIEEQGQISQ